MSEVQRYNFGIEIEGCYSQYAGEEAPQGEYVKFTDFDRVTAERDALQQRLTAADERGDVLEGLLHKAHPFTNDVAHDVDVWLEIDAALKPAEGGGDEHCS